MLNVQKYLIEHGIQKLQDEFHIEVKDYPDRVTLNYSQIDSPKFHPICDECRGLILKKDNDWSVLSRAFQRFYNVGEGEQWKSLDIPKCRIEQKIDGSLISMFHDKEKWNVATRKMAFAEGETFTGKTFAQLFEEAAKKTNVYRVANDNKDIAWIFELTSPESRVVHPYPTTSITLIGGRHKIQDTELPHDYLDAIAFQMGVPRPKEFPCSTMAEVEKMAKSLPALDEGFVIVQENHNGSHLRAKCKNPKFVAIAHLRDNGGLPTPKNILTLVMKNETAEYTNYFPEDKKFFDLVENIYTKTITNINDVWEKTKNIEDQKTFAVTILSMTTKFEASILFTVKKLKKPVREVIDLLEPKKVANHLNLKARFVESFNVKIADEEI